MKVGVDYLSNLPNDVTGKILSYLKLEEAVRTSVLSTKWRFKWAVLPDLVFDDSCISIESETTLADIVDHVLLLHIGPISKFELTVEDGIAAWDIDRWILHLSRNSIKEFVLDLYPWEPYNIPSCLFSCQDLVHLKLFYCLLNSSSTSKGFKSLKTLDMMGVTLTQNVFENLIGCSPSLETLNMRDCYGFTNLKIDAPNLRSILVAGRFNEVNLKSTSQVAHVTFSLAAPAYQRWLRDSSSNLVKLFDSLPHIRSFKIEWRFLKYLAIGTLPGKLPQPCQHLNIIYIDIFFNQPDEVLTALCLLRSCPALQELTLAVHQAEYALGEVNSWIENIEDNCQFTQLKHITIKGIHDVKAELDMINFQLLSSPVLERMVLQPASVDDSLAILKKVVEFRRASVHAVVIFLDP